MAFVMATEPRRMPTAQGISLPLKNHFLPSTSLTHLISSFSYAGAFENGLPHGQGIETYADGGKYFSRFEDSLPLIHSLAYFILFFKLRGSFRKWQAAWPRSRDDCRRRKVHPKLLRPSYTCEDRFYLPHRRFTSV